MGHSLEEKLLDRLGVVTGFAYEQGEENQGQVETGGENVHDQKIHQKPGCSKLVIMGKST